MRRRVMGAALEVGACCSRERDVLVGRVECGVVGGGGLLFVGVTCLWDA